LLCATVGRDAVIIKQKNTGNNFPIGKKCIEVFIEFLIKNSDEL
jgi:hypothetical protein